MIRHAFPETCRPPQLDQNSRKGGNWAFGAIALPTNDRNRPITSFAFTAILIAGVLFWRYQLGMRVYKFYPARWGREALAKRRLKVSPIDKLNDPFEYLSVDLGDKSVRAWATEFRKTVSQDNGIISFSRSWKQPLLWAHYADSHQGIAMGFDVPEYLLFKIDYVKNRIRPDSKIDHSQDLMEELVYKLLRTKHVEWSYEEEYRLHRPLQNCDSEGGNYFATFNEETRLKEVILGARYQSAQLVKLSSDLQSEGVNIKTARAQFREFQMTPQKLAELQKQL